MLFSIFEQTQNPFWDTWYIKCLHSRAVDVLKCQFPADKLLEFFQAHVSSWSSNTHTKLAHLDFTNKKLLIYVCISHQTQHLLNFLPCLIVPMDLILTFLEFLWRDLFKSVYFIPPPSIYGSFPSCVKSTKTCRELQILLPLPSRHLNLKKWKSVKNWTC